MFLTVATRVAMSVLLGGVFYTGWMAVAILTIKGGFGGLVVKVLLWILAPILTGLGFAVGLRTFDLLGLNADRGSFWRTYKWCLVGCGVGGGIVCVFGPMLIVFGMFAGGTLSVILYEAARAKGPH